MPHDLEALKKSLVGFGTTKIAHLDGDLLTHMTNVYLILERMGRPEHVMLAGLFHGVYGTHALHGKQAFDLPESRRDEVRSLVGEATERLVYTFSVMTYESLGKSVRNMMKPSGKPELWNRCTDQALTVTREEFHDLLWLKLADLLAHVPKFSGEAQRTAVSDYGPFWQLVAEYLGPPAVAAWNEVFTADRRMVQPSVRKPQGMDLTR